MADTSIKGSQTRVALTYQCLRRCKDIDTILSVQQY